MKKLTVLLFSLILVLSTVLFFSCGKPKFTVTFYANGGVVVSGTTSQTVSYSSDIIEPVVEKEGYEFIGWDKEISEISTDSLVYAVWSAKVYNVTFDYREYGGSAIPQLVVEYDSTVNGLPTPVRENYRFLGWYFQNGDKEERLYEDSIWTISHDITVKAKWAEIDKYYLITLKNPNPEDSLQVDYMNYWSSSVTRIKTPKKEGYVFLGWLEQGKELDESGNKIYVSELDKGTHGDKTFIADWRAEKYKVEFREYKGEANYVLVQTLYFEYNQTIGELPTVADEKEGNSFSGWTIEYDGKTVFLSSGMKWRYSIYSENEVVVAKDEWSKNTYTLNFDVNGGSSQLDGISFLYGSTVFGLPIPERTHEFYGKACFLGWFIDGDESKKIKDGDVWQFGSDVTAKAKWETRTFSVTLYKNNGESESFYEYYLGSIPLLPVPYREGYTFEKWYFDEEFTNPVEFDMTFTESKLTFFEGEYSVNLYAKWAKSAGTYTITYVLGGGKFNSTAPDYYLMSKGISLVEPNREGYDFNGFKDGENIITEISVGESGDKELVAVWLPKIYVISFDYGGFSPISVEYDSSVSGLPMHPIKPGNTFNGWVTQSGEQITEGMKWIYASDLTLSPEWKEGSVINYYLNGGNFLDKVEKSYKSTAEFILPTPARSGYTFDGWFDNPEFTGSSICVIPKGEYEEKFFYAKWEQGIYTVKFAMSWTYDGFTYAIRANGKSSVATVKLNHGETLGTRLPTKDKIQVASGKESMYFNSWVYIANGERHKVTADTVFNEENLKGVNGCEITLYPYLCRTWIPEPEY